VEKKATTGSYKPNLFWGYVEANNPKNGNAGSAAISTTQKKATLNTEYPQERRSKTYQKTGPAPSATPRKKTSKNCKNSKQKHSSKSSDSRSERSRAKNSNKTICSEQKQHDST
jgi:hypothetical protein